MGRCRVMAVSWIMLLASGEVQGARWVGPGSLTGPVIRPASYLEAVARLQVATHDFDRLAPDADVGATDLGGFVLYATPAGTPVLTRTGLVAGAAPASDPVALLVSEADAGATQVTLALDKPAVSIAFALLSLRSTAWLDVYDVDDDLVGSYRIPSAPSGVRRWIGVLPEERAVQRIVLRPTRAGAYGMDDVEIGPPAPEPTACAMALAITGFAAWRTGRPQRPRSDGQEGCQHERLA